jgi:putative N6-adenine-specific DNA methylase
MSSSPTFEIFLVAIPGLEAALTDEAKACGFQGAKQVPGGVRFDGGWPEVWRANLQLRGASRVLARIGSFHAAHLAQLDKRARAFPWRTILRCDDVPVSVESDVQEVQDLSQRSSDPAHRHGSQRGAGRHHQR